MDQCLGESIVLLAKVISAVVRLRDTLQEINFNALRQAGRRVRPVA